MRNKLLIVFTALLLTGCQSNQKTVHKKADAVPVLAVNPTVKDIPITIQSIGTLHPSIFVELRPEINGTVSEILIEEGYWVKKGDPLFIIDPKVYLAKVQEAEAQLRMDHANLQAIGRKLDRFRPLAEKDLIARTEWDDLETAAEKSRAQIQLDECRLNAAKIDLDACTLSSPTEGRVGKLDAHLGMLVARGQAAPLATLSKMDPLIVEFAVTENEFSKLRPQSEIEISSLLSADTKKSGVITFFDNHFDKKTGMLLVRGLIANPGYSLRPGQSIRVTIPVDNLSQAKLIPQKSVKHNQQGPYIYVVQSDMTVAFRQIVLGDDYGDNITVLEGVDETDFIITDGHLRLSPGIKVEIKQ